MIYVYATVIVFILAYIYCYFIYPSYISIIQTSLEDFDFNLLLKRQPIVIEDRIKDIINVINSWFSPNIIQDIQFDTKRIWNVNSHKYLYVYTLIDSELLLFAPGNKVTDDVPDSNESVIEIKLKANQSAIIPFRWYYSIKNIDDVKLYGIHDYITYALDFIV